MAESDWIVVGSEQIPLHRRHKRFVGGKMGFCVFWYSWNYPGLEGGRWCLSWSVRGCQWRRIML